MSVVFEHGTLISSISPQTLNGFTRLQTFLYSSHLSGELPEIAIATDNSLLHSPFSLPDIVPAVTKISEAIKNKKHIMIYGDRDSDGVIATSILAREIQNLHQGVLTVRTTSSDEDYGLCESTMNTILSCKPDLLLTVDFGSSNFNEINQLASCGIDTIVIDHHEIPEKIPNCILVNPKRTDSSYPFQNICSAVLAWKTLLAYYYFQSNEFNKHYWLFTDANEESGILIKNGIQIYRGKLENSKKEFPDGYYHYPPGINPDFPDRRIFFYQVTKKSDIYLKTEKYLALAAIGTITDLMPLFDENRIIVKSGMHLMTKIPEKYPELTGLKYLLENLGMQKPKIYSKDLGWTVGPCINAAGRMGKSEIALNLLLTNDNTLAKQLSQELIAINLERRERTKRNLKRAENFLNNDKTSSPVIFCYTDEMEPGVSGIVASKLVNDFGKPAVFIANEKEYAKGSVRASGNEDVLSLVTQLEKHLIQFGGHKQAAGFSIKREEIENFEKTLFEKAHEWVKQNSSVEFSNKSHFSVLPHELNRNLFNEISTMEPFGQGNPSPLISLQKTKIMNFKPMGNGEHASFKIQGSDIRFVIWNKASLLEDSLSRLNTMCLWGNLEENYFNGRSIIQFSVVHFQ